MVALANVVSCVAGAVTVSSEPLTMLVTAAATNVPVVAPAANVMVPICAPSFATIKTVEAVGAVVHFATEPVIEAGMVNGRTASKDIMTADAAGLPMHEPATSYAIFAFGTDTTPPAM